MMMKLPKKLHSLASSLDKPLYAVGGVVRNFLINWSIAEDIDLASALTVEQLKPSLEKFGFIICAEYKRTGTIMFTDGENKYEYTTFRSEVYALGGGHTPIKTEFTEDIKKDALRRDFKCNAIYYDIKKGEIVDPLGGVEDVRNKRLDTVTNPDEVFAVDGLRLLRLARFAGELDFQPTVAVLNGASKNADNILDISPERIYAELSMILLADRKYPFSDPMGHYNALKILDNTRVLDRIFPELTDGRGMAQRADFHKYDVLEHGLRCVAYAHPSIRWGAFLHDVGKPFCFKRDGYYYHHFSEGEKIAERILKRLRADGETIKSVKFLVREHMVDLDCSMKESKVRKFIVKNYDRLDDLLRVKQADFRASLEIDYVAPTLVKWNKLLEEMKKDGTPFSLKELGVSARDLMDIGYRDAEIGKQLSALWEYAILHPHFNTKKALLERAKKQFKAK